MVRSVSFGIFPTPAAADLGSIWEAVRIADTGGLDLVGVQDHPYQRRFLDAFSLLSAIAVRTQRLKVFPDVTSVPLRSPAVIAKTASSIDLMSGGRFELALGAGSFWDAIAAIGGPRRTPGESLRALAEAIDVIRLMWSDERSVRYEGEHYQLAGVRPGPRPAHEIGIWLGVYGPQALKLLGEKADGWVFSIPSMPVDEIDARQSRVDEAAVAVGRNPAGIRRIANVNGVITNGSSEGFLRGPRDQWVDELAALSADQRIDGFVLWPDGDLVEQTARFTEVAAAVRASRS